MNRKPSPIAMMTAVSAGLALYVVAYDLLAKPAPIVRTGADGNLHRSIGPSWGVAVIDADDRRFDAVTCFLGPVHWLDKRIRPHHGL